MQPAWIDQTLYLMLPVALSLHPLVLRVNAVRLNRCKRLQPHDRRAEDQKQYQRGAKPKRQV